MVKANDRVFGLVVAQFKRDGGVACHYYNRSASSFWSGVVRVVVRAKRSLNVIISRVVRVVRVKSYFILYRG